MCVEAAHLTQHKAFCLCISVEVSACVYTSMVCVCMHQWCVNAVQGILCAYCGTFQCYIEGTYMDGLPYEVGTMLR
jgi:hypothetical protein